MPQPEDDVPERRLGWLGGTLDELESFIRAARAAGARGDEFVYAQGGPDTVPVALHLYVKDPAPSDERRTG